MPQVDQLLGEELLPAEGTLRLGGGGQSQATQHSISNKTDVPVSLRESVSETLQAVGVHDRDSDQ